MPNTKKPRISPNSIRRRTEALHRAAGEAGDNFLQYMFGMALLHLDNQAARIHDQGATTPGGDDPQVAKAAKLIRSASTRRN